MTTKQSNLEDLIKENAKLKQFVYEEIAYAMFIGNDYSKAEALARLKKMARELCAELGMEAPVIETPEAIAPKPKFAVGDRVRIIGNQETPPPISDYAVGEYDTIATIEEKDGYKLRYHGGQVGSLVWYGRELIPYNDTEAPKPDLSFTAHEDATSNGCQMCGNEWKSLNKEGYCSSCWTVWKS